jgi:hypothetical protein
MNLRMRSDTSPLNDTTKLVNPHLSASYAVGLEGPGHPVLAPSPDLFHWYVIRKGVAAGES